MNEQIEKAIEEVVRCAQTLTRLRQHLFEGGCGYQADYEEADKELALAKAHLKFLINKEINGQ